jgi:hypothetical protein
MLSNCICICYIALNGNETVIDELEKLWKKVVVGCIKVLSQHLSGVTEGNHGKLHHNN